MDKAYASGLVKNQQRRKAAVADQPVRDVLLVEGNRQRVAVLSHKLECFLPRFTSRVDIDGPNADLPPQLIFAVEFLDFRQLAAAGGTPRRPEVQHHHAATQLRRADSCAVRSG